MTKKTAKLRGCSVEWLPSGQPRLKWRWQGRQQSIVLDEKNTAEGREKAARMANLVAAYKKDHRNPECLFGRTTVTPTKVGETFEEYLTIWQRRRSPFSEDGKLIKDAKIRPTTWLHDASSIKRLVAGLGHLDVVKLKRSDFEEFEYQLRQEKRPSGDPLLSGGTINKITSLAHAALAPLVEDGTLPRNPAPKTTAIVSDVNRRPLEPETIAKFIDMLPKSLVLDDGAVISGTMLRVHYRLWSMTGMRSNEIGALQYGDLDVEHQVIQVRRGRSPRSYGQEEGLVAKPKNRKGRELDCGFNPEIFKLIGQLKEDWLAAGKPIWLFHDSRGNPLSEELLHKRCWRPGLRLLGLPEEDEKQGSYVLRHSFACAALSAGENPGWVASFLGHSEQMLWQRYRRYILRANKNAPGTALAARMRQSLTSGTERSTNVPFAAPAN